MRNMYDVLSNNIDFFNRGFKLFVIHFVFPGFSFYVHGGYLTKEGGQCKGFVLSFTIGI